MDDMKICDTAAATVIRTRTTPMPEGAPDGFNGLDLIETVGFGNSPAAIRQDALDTARGLYGQRAQLEIEEAGTIRETRKPENRHRGAFNADVYVRCLNYTELGL